MLKAYASHRVTTETADKMTQTRLMFDGLQNMLNEILPHGRYASLTGTKLEEACMFAIKSLSHDDPSSVQVEPVKSEGSNG